MKAAPFGRAGMARDDGAQAPKEGLVNKLRRVAGRAFWGKAMRGRKILPLHPETAADTSFGISGASGTPECHPGSHSSDAGQGSLQLHEALAPGDKSSCFWNPSVHQKAMFRCDSADSTRSSVDVDDLMGQRRAATWQWVHCSDQRTCPVTKWLHAVCVSSMALLQRTRRHIQGTPYLSSSLTTLLPLLVAGLLTVFPEVLMKLPFGWRLLLGLGLSAPSLMGAVSISWVHQGIKIHGGQVEIVYSRGNALKWPTDTVADVRVSARKSSVLPKSTKTKSGI